MNVYRQRKQEEFDTIQSNIESLQARAADEDRDLTEDELKLIRAQGDMATKLAAEIKTLAESETRAANVAALAAKTTQAVSNTVATDRDPGHYRSAEEGGNRSFFQDMFNSANGDRQAAERLHQHTRALTFGDNGVGIVPPKWLTDQYQGINRQGRVLPLLVTTIGLGTDPRAFQIPKQTAGTAVTFQADACANPTPANTFDTDLDTVTPTVATALVEICRSFIDSASPAVDQLVWSDLMSAYDSGVETVIGNAILAAAAAPIAGGTFATEAAFTASNGGPAYDAVISAAMDVWEKRKAPADLLLMRTRRWGNWLKFKDTTGRPLIPMAGGGATGVNVFGNGDASGLTYNSPGNIDGLRVAVTEGLGTTAYAESMVVQKASDVLFFEGTNFRFQDPYSLGPAIIRLGLWNYLATYVRYPGLSGERVTITAAS